MKQIRQRLTYANVMSSIAVFLILGGATAFAASQIEENSVGSKQLKQNAVTAAKIKKDAITAAKVKDGSLLSGDFKAGQLPAGPQGATGPVGPVGPRGPSHGRASSVAGNVQVGTSPAAPVVVDSLSLTPGKWMLTATTVLTNVSGASRDAWCTLNSGSAELGRTRAFDLSPATQRTASATVLGAVDLTSAGAVEFRCWASGAQVFTPSESRPAMQAIQVETLSID